MRDKDRIDRITNKLNELWKRVPDQRFMQLISNIYQGESKDPFYVEDDLFESWVDNNIFTD